MFFNIGGLLFVLLVGSVLMEEIVDFFHFARTNTIKIYFHNNKEDRELIEKNDQGQTKTLEIIFDKKVSKAPVKYEDKYIDLLKSQKNTNLLQNIPNKINKVMEYTPLGNVVMWYEPDNESFHFHSDSTIPYRFLEVVARKYVTTFCCPQIYVDMEEQVELAKQKLQHQKEDKERKQNELIEQIKLEQDTSNKLTTTTTTAKPKSNVFAKFKDYNKMQSKSSAAAPKVVTTTKENEDMILKENANRFTCDGRFSNFQLLVKIDKKVVDKRLNLSFADFKLLNK